MKWANVFKVFRWEFLKNARSPAFLLTTLMIPLIMFLSAGISYFATNSAMKEELQVAVIDETREFFPYLESNLADSSHKVTLYEPAQREQLVQQVEDGKLNGYIIFTKENVESGMIDYYVRDAKEANIGAFNGAVTSAVTVYRMERIGLSAEEITLATSPVVLNSRSVKGEEFSIAEAIAPFFFAMVLVVAVMISGQVLMYGVIKEKRNRIIEILLSSVSALDLLVGKIIGFGLLGLLQIGIWLGVGLAAASRYIDLSQLGLGVSKLIPMVLFFIGGYVMFAALYAAMGATMKDAEGGSQIQSLVVIIPMIPLFASGAIIMSPNALWVKICSYIPIFTPTMMLMRIGATTLHWWELAAAFAALLLGVAFFIYLGARIFSRSLLQFERTLSFVEIGKMMRKNY
ncbi:MAG: ABC transporter permease [Syntrophaceticus sp.]|nr:ABC transporter permease [Syntrophaceticus sp.]MDD4360627.1 ABC transporter permease [Syntrophaceticus sp.]